MFTDLMVYDLGQNEGGVSLDDFVDCLEEFMLENYSTEVEPEHSE